MKEMVNLTLSNLPDPDDGPAIFAFSMSFNGYEHYGSFEVSATAARMRKRSSVIELRNELFFVARASRHLDSDAYVERYRELLPIFQELLVA